MRVVNNTLFEKLKSRALTLATCWSVTRQDGMRFGFTSHDQEFVCDPGDGFGPMTFYPESGISGEAVVSKNDFSTNNSSARVVFSQHITEHDVRIGLFDYADVRSFWVDPNHPEHGIIPLQRGNMGEVVLKNNEFEAELRSLLDRFQLPWGRQYNLECSARLGDARCGVPMDPPVWAPNTTWVASIDGDARVGAVVKPSVYNGFWYRAISASGNTTTLQFPRGTVYAGLGPDPFTGTGINPFQGLGPWYGVLFAQLYQSAISQPSTIPGTPYTVPVTLYGGNTGATEPAWPAANGATVNDGQIVWKAFPARIVTGSVTGPISRTQFQDANRTEVSNYFQYGVLKWLTGENAGRTVEVRQYKKLPGNPAQFTVLEVMPLPIMAGDTYEVSVGCSKIRQDCIHKFNNILNYRGFPDMPTEDRALTSPNFSAAQQLNFQEQGGGGKK